MKVLFLDCFSGISGDMTVGALCDLGVKPSALEWELSKVDLGDFHMHFDRAQRKNIEGVKFGIHEGTTHTHHQDDHDHHHHEDHDEHHHEEHDHEEHDHEEHDHDHHDHESDAAHSHAVEDHDHGDEAEQVHAHADAEAHAHSHSHAHAQSHEEHEHEHGHESHAHAHSHEHTHVHEHEHQHEDGHSHSHAHSHTHTHEHEHGEHCHHDHEHGHEHAHGRTHAEIRSLIESSDLSPFVKKHALGIFQRIAVAEGKIHGMPPAEVGFHEVGALDSIADIICTCVGIEALGVEAVYVSSLHDGRGSVHCAHGEFPLPAPATVEILAGIPLSQIDEPHELITPTGAAIVAEFGQSFGLMPRLKTEKVGYGIGSRDLASRPNVLRAILGELAEDE